MTTISRIVVATDFSPVSNAAIGRAVQLADVHGASLCLLHASDAGASSAGGAAAPDPAQRLAALAATLPPPAGRAIDVHHAVGTPVAVIDAYVRSHEGTLVVIGSRADPALSGLGSTASTVVRMPGCPVLVVRALETAPYARVLSAVDLREGSVRAATRALELLPFAHHHLLYAVQATAGSAPWLRAERELLQFAQRLSAQAAQPVDAVVADDRPERAILVRAAELPADCVVVGHHGHGPATVRALGSMAQHVIHSALSDVLVVP